MYDIIVFGATSFVGKIVVQHLADTYKANNGLKWAMAARNEEKLKKLLTDLDTGDISPDIFVVDAQNENQLKHLVTQTKVILTTVGPYARFGETLVKVCAEQGTDYCDLTGEVPWMKRMLTKYQKTAEASGARLVHCCGFDSIPSDLGVFHLQQRSKDALGETCHQVSMRVANARGGVSGGTFASLIGVLEEAADGGVKKVLSDPYTLCQKPTTNPTPQEKTILPRFDHDMKGWVGPFVMSGINTRIVHKTNSLLNERYGKTFTYDEGIYTGKGIKGAMISGATSLVLGGFVGLCYPSFTRKLLLNFVLPKPGKGPSEQLQKQGFFDLQFVGKTKDGKVIKTTVSGDADPGYGSTAKMVVETAICLKDHPDTRGGFWTPASLMGEKLIKRLESHAGLTFKTLETAES